MTGAGAPGRLGDPGVSGRAAGSGSTGVLPGTGSGLIGVISGAGCRGVGRASSSRDAGSISDRSGGFSQGDVVVSGWLVSTSWAPGWGLTISNLRENVENGKYETSDGVVCPNAIAPLLVCHSERMARAPGPLAGCGDVVNDLHCKELGICVLLPGGPLTKP